MSRYCSQWNVCGGDWNKVVSSTVCTDYYILPIVCSSTDYPQSECHTVRKAKRAPHESGHSGQSLDDLQVC